jgi:hypothetical protein
LATRIIRIFIHKIRQRCQAPPQIVTRKFRSAKNQTYSSAPIIAR